MNEPWRIAAAVAFLALLAGALVWVVVVGGADEASSDTTGIVAVVTPASAVPSPPSSVSTTTTASTAAPTTLPPTVLTFPPPPVEVTLADVLPAVDAAFAAWGEFAVTGDLDLVESTFDAAGPQYTQLRGEAPALSADPLGPPPYVFTVIDPRLRRPDPDRAVVVGDVTVDRPEEPTQTFRWRIVMSWVGGDWRLWTVDDIGE